MRSNYDADREMVNYLVRAKNRLANEIINNAEKHQISLKSLYGRGALAENLLNIGFKRGLRKIKCYLGLHGQSGRYFNHRLRQAAQGLAISYYRRLSVSCNETLGVIKTVRTY